MKFNVYLIWICLAGIICGIVSCGKEDTFYLNEGRPNVLLIVADDLGWMDLGFMGSEYYETPHLDALASQGMIFTQAYASASNCAPSRACMLSGMQSPRHGVYTVSPSERGDTRTRKLIPIVNKPHLINEVFTLPELFKSTGYVTGSFGKWHIGHDPREQGIDVNVGGSHRGNPGKVGYFSPYNIDYIEDGPTGEYLTDRLTDEAIHFINTNKDNPFFLYLPYYTVHTPIMAKQELIERFKSKPTSPGQSNPEYAAMIYSLDENIGRILNSLNELQLENNTLIIFTSDNGGIRAISSQEPLRAGKGSYYEGGIRVPLIVKWPDEIAKGSACATRVTNLDFYPTIKSILNIKQSAHTLDGTDITPLFAGGQIAERDLFWHFPIYLQAYNPQLDDGKDPLFRTRPGTVMISGDYKLHEYYEDQSLELYNLKLDPGERNNLANTQVVKSKELHEKMNLWRIDLSAPIPKNDNPEYDSSYERLQLSKL